MKTQSVIGSPAKPGQTPNTQGKPTRQPTGQPAQSRPPKPKS